MPLNKLMLKISFSVISRRDHWIKSNPLNKRQRTKFLEELPLYVAEKNYMDLFS